MLVDGNRLDNVDVNRVAGTQLTLAETEKSYSGSRAELVPAAALKGTPGAATQPMSATAAAPNGMSQAVHPIDEFGRAAPLDPTDSASRCAAPKS